MTLLIEARHAPERPGGRLLWALFLAAKMSKNRNGVRAVSGQGFTCVSK
jgi:hypothetical protein